MIAQKLGFSIERIAKALKPLPIHRAPSKAEWNRLSTDFRSELNDRIAALTRLRDKLDGCIGCGCLSLENCALYNPEDEVSVSGPGPRFILEDASFGEDA